GYELSPDFIGNTPVIYDQKEAFEGAHFIYGKNWSSYHQYGQILTDGRDWVVDEEKMALTDNGFFMHCLSVRRNLKVTDGVLDSTKDERAVMMSIIYAQDVPSTVWGRTLWRRECIDRRFFEQESGSNY